jgi:ABC-2 type transport system ATP-binding protein
MVPLPSNGSRRCGYLSIDPSPPSREGSEPRSLSAWRAKRPRVLLLDEPLAALDPLVRRQFLTSLADVTVEGDVTAVLSSHLVHDLERVCNQTILLTSSRVRLCADIDDVLSTHRVLVGPRRSTGELERALNVVRVTQTERQSRVLARLDGPVLDPAWRCPRLGSNTSSSPTWPRTRP